MSQDKNEPPIRVLTLDGGGIRGLASLMILREIMNAIKLETNADAIPRPCDCFDLIGGTSTGGLIAIMLGRLGMTVDECIIAYQTVSTNVFKVDKVLANTIPVGDDKCRFNYNDLERVIKDMIRVRLKDEDLPMSSDTNKPSCRTFVVATIAEDTSGPPILFRSYDIRGYGLTPANECPIWQAARATSAAPTFFKPMRIGMVKYADGGLGYNNPSQLAVDEVRKIWPDHTPNCLISIGTGHQSAVKVYTSKDLDSNLNAQRSVFDQVKAFVPEILGKLPQGKKIKNFPAGVVAVIKMANAISQLVTSSNDVHIRLENDNNRPPTFEYFRFDVERGVGDIGLADLAKMDEIAGLVTSYVNHPTMINKKMKCIKHFRSRIDPPADGNVAPSADEIEREIGKWMQRIQKSPSDHRWQIRLAKVYSHCDISRAILGWKDLVNEFPGEWKLQTQLANALASASHSQQKELKEDPIETAVEIWKELVTEHPTVWGLHVQLQKAFQKKNDIDEEIFIWAELVDLYPDDWKLQSELAEAYEKKEGLNSVISEKTISAVDMQIKEWKQLVHRHPEAWELQVRLANAFRKKEKLEAVVGVLKTLSSKKPENKIANMIVRKAKATVEISCWEDLVNEHPDSRGLQMQLDMAYNRKSDIGRAIKGWKRLVNTHPDKQELAIYLKRTYQWNEKESSENEDRHIDAEIEGWKELVVKHPDKSTLQTHLAEAYSKRNDLVYQIQGWIGLVNEFPGEQELSDRLVHALLQCETEDAAMNALQDLDLHQQKNQDLVEFVKEMFNELR